MQSRVVGRGWVVPDDVIKTDWRIRAGPECWLKALQDPGKEKGPLQAEPGWKRAELLPGYGSVQWYAEKTWGARDVGREEAGDRLDLTV